MTDLSVSSIKVSGRHRQSLGDLEALAESIKSLGLLHPIVVTKTGRLVAGERRLEACKLLGLTEVPIRVIADLTSAAALLQAERDENTCRLDMTPSEKVALGRELEELERPKARERQGTRTDLQHSEKFTESGTHPAPDPLANIRSRYKGTKAHPQTDDLVGEAVGMSRPTYQRAKRIVDAAAEDPEKYGDLKERMDATGKVSGVHDELQARRRSKPEQPNPRGFNGRERVGSRTVKQAVASLKQAAINVDSTAAGFEMESFGDLALLAPHPEAQEWIELLVDATRRLSAHVRTIRRYQKEAQ